MCKTYIKFLQIKIISITIILLVGTNLNAESIKLEGYQPSYPGKLTKEMTFYDILNLMGPAITKKVNEKNRADIWTYPEVKVRFKEGKVTKLTYLKSGYENLDELKPKKKKIRKRKKNPEVSQEVIYDILKVVEEKGSNSAVKNTKSKRSVPRRRR